MSMNTVTYPGYGIDLGDLDLNLTDPKLTQFWQKQVLMPNDDMTDYMDTPNSPYIQMVLPQNTDSFKLLILISDIPGVRLSHCGRRQLTKDEANQILIDEAKRLIDLADHSNLSSDELLTVKLAASKAINQDADYHYSDEFSDEI